MAEEGNPAFNAYLYVKAQEAQQAKREDDPAYIKFRKELRAQRRLHQFVEAAMDFSWHRSGKLRTRGKRRRHRFKYDPNFPFQQVLRRLAYYQRLKRDRMLDRQLAITAKADARTIQAMVDSGIPLERWLVRNWASDARLDLAEDVQNILYEDRDLKHVKGGLSEIIKRKH